MNTYKSLSGEHFKYLIKERIKNFWGYGNLDGDIWFVGMEEGYNQDTEVLLKRLQATSGAKVFDIYDDLKVDPGHVTWFEEGAPTQATYRKLIYMLLYLQNRAEPNIEDIRDFQIHNFGRKSSNHAVLELMPLPVKSTKKKDWLYGELSIDELSTRNEYLATYKSKRVEDLKIMVAKHKPKVLIMYSLEYKNDCEQIAGKPLEEVISRRLYIVKSHDTIYIVTPHSTARGLSNNDWREIAERILSVTYL